MARVGIFVNAVVACCRISGSFHVKPKSRTGWGSEIPGSTSILNSLKMEPQLVI